MNGPTMRRRALGSPRRTVKPPMSAVRGTMTRSIASQAGASPGVGSLAGEKLMGLPHGSCGWRNGGDQLHKFVSAAWISRWRAGRGRRDAEAALLYVERFGAGRLARGIEGDLLDARLGLAQQLLAAALERFAALVDGNRFLERDVAALELLHDRLELGQRLLERQRLHVGIGLFRHHRSCRRV